MYNIEPVFFDQHPIILKIDGELIKFPISKRSKKLAIARYIERELFSISPSGYGIHWHLNDEDRSIDSLLKIASIGKQH